MSKFEKWKEKHDGLWYMFLLPMAVGLVAIPSVVLSVYAVMNLAFLKKALLVVLGVAGIVFAVWIVGLVLCLLHGALSDLFDSVTGKGE